LSLRLIVAPVKCRLVNCHRLTVARLSVASPAGSTAPPVISGGGDPQQQQQPSGLLQY